MPSLDRANGHKVCVKTLRLVDSAFSDSQSERPSLVRIWCVSISSWRCSQSSVSSCGAKESSGSFHGKSRKRSRRGWRWHWHQLQSEKLNLAPQSEIRNFQSSQMFAEGQSKSKNFKVSRESLRKPWWSTLAFMTTEFRWCSWVWNINKLSILMLNCWWRPWSWTTARLHWSKLFYFNQFCRNGILSQTQLHHIHGCDS